MIFCEVKSIRSDNMKAERTYSTRLETRSRIREADILSPDALTITNPKLSDESKLYWYFRDYYIPTYTKAYIETFILFQKHEQDEKEIRRHIIDKYSLLSRECNSLMREVKGMIACRIEMMKIQLEEQEEKLKSIPKKLEELEQNNKNLKNT